MLNITLTVGFQNVHPPKNGPQVVYYQKQVGDFGAIFVRKHPLDPGLCWLKAGLASQMPVGNITFNEHMDSNTTQCYISAQFLGETVWPAVVLRVWDTLIIHTSVACNHTSY